MPREADPDREDAAVAALDSELAGLRREMSQLRADGTAEPGAR